MTTRHRTKNTVELLCEKNNSDRTLSFKGPMAIETREHGLHSLFHLLISITQVSHHFLRFWLEVFATRLEQA